MISPSAFFAPAMKPGATGPGFQPNHAAQPGGDPADFDKCLTGASRKPGSKDDDEKRSKAAHSHHPRSAKRPASALDAEPANPAPAQVPTKEPPVVEPPVTIAPAWHAIATADEVTQDAEATDPTENTGPAPVLDPTIPPGGLRPLVKEAASATVIAPTQRTLNALVGESSQPPPAALPSANERGGDAPEVAEQPGKPTVDDAAKIAGPLLPKGGLATAKVEISSSQLVDLKQLKSESQSDGTPIANGNVAVNATNPNLAKLADAGTLLKRATAVSSVAELPDHPTAGKHSGAPVATAVPGGEPTVSFPTPGAKEATAANASTAVEHFTKIETLLQNVLHVGEALRPNGQCEMEMRLRLNGGADDVTVRWQVTGDRLQVSFHTDSAGLRQALESGWKQFSNEQAVSSTLAFAEPNFAPSLPGGFAPDQQTGGDFSSSQQQSPSRDLDTNAVPVSTWKSAPSTTLTTDSPVRSERAGGWRGWA